MNTWVTHNSDIIRYLCDGDIRLGGMREGDKYKVSRTGHYIYYDERSPANVKPGWAYRMVVLFGKPALISKEPANAGARCS